MEPRRGTLVASALLALALLPSVAPANGEKVIAWNSLGMHCMDADYAVFSILPPYNTVYAQVIDGGGNLVTDPSGLIVTYRAVADPQGSINTTSAGKTDFWEHVLELFGVNLEPDQGLAGFDMPGPGNQPRAMVWDAAQRWFVAEGIPITPTDDRGFANPYPTMRVTVTGASGQALATTDIVLPVSDEMDCRACHGSGSDPAAEPASGWVFDPDPERDHRRNILRLHDEHRQAKGSIAKALAQAGYEAAGLEATAKSGTSVLCARCHPSNAMPGSGFQGLPPLTRAVHGRHASVTDPVTGLSLDATENRSACYRCHPGRETRCLRGAMGTAVAADGTPAMQCQSCHGGMSAVGGDREGWLEEPGCGSCHTGTATVNSGQIRYTSVFDSPGHERVPADPTFATTPDTPSAGFSLYQFSTGHGGLACQACHGPTHAEYPSTQPSDNLQSNRLQGHEGTISDCTSCHGSSPSTVSGGPHGMHPVGQVWVSEHEDAAEHGGAARCQPCHGVDYRGTVLSRALGDRTLSTEFGTRSFWRGYRIGCYTCHDGPSDDDPSSNHPPTVGDRTVTTSHDTPVNVPLSAIDVDGDPLTLRVVSQPAHGTVGLAGTTATYLPEPDFGGGDAFTYAAWDGKADSNLATVTVTVIPAALTAAASASPLSGLPPLTVHFEGRPAGGIQPYTYEWDFADSSPPSPLPRPTHVYAHAGIFPVTFTVRDAGGGVTSAFLTVVVGTGASSERYLVPGVAHNPGAGATLWRTDVAAVNLGASEAAVTLTFRSESGTLGATSTVPAGGAVEWLNVVEGILGADPGASLSGSLEVAADTPLFVAARTFNQTPEGTFGQALPALTAAEALARGDVGVLPQLRRGAEFRTNVGAVNLGTTSAEMQLRLIGADGAQVGGDLSLSVPPGEWRQSNDVFTASGAGEREVAFATVEVTSGDGVWVYASLVDVRTGDPTTIAVQRR